MMLARGRGDGVKLVDGDRTAAIRSFWAIPLCLPAVVDFNESVVHEKLERIRRILDGKAKTCGEALRALRKRLGLPEGLRSEGVTEADIPKLADKAMEDACHRCNPRPVTREDLAGLYRASL